MNKSILITGANSGIGKDTARQLALQKDTEIIYLACRNKERALAAKKELENITGKSIFKIILMDVSIPDSVRKAVASLNQPIDALIMNAGGMGGTQPGNLNKDGVTNMFATNVLGHVVLVDELLNANKLNNVALFTSSEAARGVPKMGMKRPELKFSSTDEFASIIDGTFSKEKFDPMQAYGYVKYTGTLWMASMARKAPHIRFISMSPGGTSGTDIMDKLPPIERFIFKYIGVPLMPYFGLMHKLEQGAERIVDGITNPKFKSGIFYGSDAKKLTGPVLDQSTIFKDLSNSVFQDHANEAIHRFIN